MKRVTMETVKPKVLAPETLREIVEEARVERPLDRSLASAFLYTKQSQELINTCTDASGSQSRSNTKKNRISPAKSDNKKKVEEHPRTNKSSLKKSNHVNYVKANDAILRNMQNQGQGRTDRPLVFGLRLLKTYDGGSLTALEFREKVHRDNEGLGHNLFSVRQFCDSDLEVAFRKHSCYVRDTDGVELIKGSRGSNLYTISVEDMMKSSPIYLLSKASKNKSWFTWVKFLRSKDETSEFVLKFLNQIQVGLNKTIRYIRTDNGTEFVNQVLTTYCETVGIFHQKSFPRTPQQNGVVERRNHTLVEAARTMLIVSKALMFLWAESVATACYTQNRSLIHTRHNKTPYELVHDKKPDLTFFESLVLFVTLQMTARILENCNQQLILEFSLVMHQAGRPMAHVQLSTGLAPTFLMPGQISSGLVPNPVPAAPYVPPTNKELEIIFQPMFDEYLEPPRVERLVSPAPAVPVPANLISTPSSTTIDQDAPSPSHSPSSLALQSLSSHQGVGVGSTIIEDNPFAYAVNDPFVNVFALEPISMASSSEDVSLAKSTHVTQPHHHLGK
ncbi:integrase, catalytic region, zinc finger, CCHC-type containing protein [Tanacetum coccineum]